MEDISKLLKEAKPLYFARKRRNNIIKSVCAMFVGVFMLGSLWPQPQSEFDIYGYYFMLDDSTLTSSNLAEYGLPTDDYGLLMVG